MGMSANLHGASKVEAGMAESGTSWLEIKNDNGDSVSVFMPFDIALRMQRAFAAPPQDADADDFDDGNITP